MVGEGVAADALSALLARRSAWPLAEPGPTDAALARILDAAACAPDHAGLRPWQFQLVRGAARHELLRQVLAQPQAQVPEVRELHGKYTAKLTTAPVVIVLAARIVPHPKAPEFEQLLTCGAAVMNMLNAAHLLGYAGFWSSTPEPLDGLLRSVMGFAPQDHMLGLLNLGTPVNPPSRQPRPVRATYAREWPPSAHSI
ncbi:nitroreductase [Corticibacter populi]|nr:nitroreductase [Corticibacter populi]